jgi:hypothetical protein
LIGENTAESDGLPLPAGRHGGHYLTMQHGSEYERGYEAALSDAKGGWALCWMPARQLATDAVYGPHGLSEEQRGYADGLAQAFPAGLYEAPPFLEGPLEDPLLYPEREKSRAAAQQAAETAAREEARKPCCGPCNGARPAPGVGVRGDAKKELTAEERKQFLARFM